MPVDDPKLDPVWDICGQHHRPVMIHTADPAAFFTPLDRFNERWHELNEHPQWLFYGEKFPQREELLEQFLRVVRSAPEDDVHRRPLRQQCRGPGGGRPSRWTSIPNLYVDIDARISELGRSPYSARKFFIKYQDRIMFGTDTTPRRDAFRIYYRFLETDDEYFDCAASHHLQGFWSIYGLFLPDEVLEKIYAKNAERVLLAQVETPSVKGDETVANEKPIADQKAMPELHVPRTADFEVTGDGSNAAWKKTAWTPL